MATQSEGSGQDSPDLLFARKQLANLQAQLPRVEAAAFNGAAEYAAYEQVARRIEQLEGVIAAVETEEEQYHQRHRTPVPTVLCSRRTR